MIYSKTENGILISGCEDFDLAKTFECGQCFRWNRASDGSWLGVAGGRAVRMRQLHEDVLICCGMEEFEGFWRDYFDLERDYASGRRAVSVGEYMTAAAEYGRGIRLLRQERWEALCSFIISQCNNISRIKGIVERLCEAFGEPFEHEGAVYYAFPSPERIAALETHELDCIRSGYRAEYIIAAAREIASGELDLDALADGDFETARRRLRAMRGIGEKVANCVILFGLNMHRAFPVDVWMKRALKEHFPPDFDPAVFGENAGLAQQYIFHYARTGGDNNAVAEKI